MGYCVQADLSAVISDPRLAQLTAETGSTPTASVITEAITEASSTIDRYIAGQAALPVTDTTFIAILKPIAVILTKSLLYDRRSLQLSDSEQRRYDAAMKYLEDVSRGLVQIPPSATRPSAPTSTGGSVLWASDAQVFIEDDTSEDSAY